MANTLGKDDFENLSAFLDGELDGDRAAEVERLVRQEEPWRTAHRELTAVDSLLDEYTVPRPPGDLADRVLTGVRAADRRSHVLRVMAWVGPAAAAAAIVLIALALAGRLGWPGDASPKQPIVAAVNPREIESSQAYEDVPQAQRAELEKEIVKNYGVLRGLIDDYDVIADFDTLEAIEKVEQEGT